MGFFGVAVVVTGVARFEHRSRVEAPLEGVWQFHVEVDALPAVTPGWMRLRVESVSAPGGEPGSDVLEEGTEVTLSLRPLGVGPGTRWTSRVVDLERREDEAWFRDEMVDGPFPRWIHTHRFRADGDRTVVTDRVAYRLPLVPGPLSVLARPALKSLFAYRHRRTRRLLADGGA